jgi:iron complex transport system substrate-binding protein
MRRGAILWLILSLVLVACRASSAETTIQLEGPTAVETDPAFPVTIDTDLGPVTIETRPDRIVSLSATATEMLFAVGAGPQLVATDLTSNYPPAALDTPKLDSFNFNVEEVAALDPDLVILAFDFQGESEALAALDIRSVLHGPATDLAAAFAQLADVGRATGHGPAAEELATRLAQDVAAIQAAAAPVGGVSFYHEVDETLYSATSASFIGDLYRRLGLVNIADAAALDSPFPQLSAEFIVDQNPDFIFLADGNFGVTVESVAARPGWDTLTAVSEGNLVVLDGDLAGRWGPRTVELMGAILAAVEDRLS